MFIKTLFSKSNLSRREVQFLSYPYSLIWAKNKGIREKYKSVRFLLRAFLKIRVRYGNRYFVINQY